jgi:thiazole synthase
MSRAIAAAETEMITVALRRVDLDTPGDDLMNHLDPAKTVFLVNTSGATNADEALRLARLARQAGFAPWIKVEVIPDARWLMPDPVETLKASMAMVAEGFTVLPYIQADPVLARRLEDAGCAAVMPLASPIGSNLGLKTIAALKMIVEQSSIPVVIDAGLGAPSHAACAMELGADAVLVNTAIATAGDPVSMAQAFAQAVVAGRRGYLAGLPGARLEAHASSPLTGFLT